MSQDHYGLSAARLVAGFAGGLLYTFAIKDRDPLSVFSSVVAGALTANFLSDATAHVIPAWVGSGGISFLTGLGAMIICQTAIAWMRLRLRLLVPKDLDKEKNS